MPMKRSWLYALIVLVVAGLGYGAFSLGRGLRGSATDVSGEPSGQFAGTSFQNPEDVSDVKLVNAEGEQVNISDFSGNVVFAFFGFTRCPDVCPLTLGRLAKIYSDLGEPEDMQVIMVSVDPEHDTPEITNSYVSGFHPDFVGLSGSSADIAEAAKRFFAGFRGMGTDNYFHTDALFVLDRSGNMRLVYGQDKVVNLEQDIPVILAQNW